MALVVGVAVEVHEQWDGAEHVQWVGDVTAALV